MQDVIQKDSNTLYLLYLVLCSPKFFPGSIIIVGALSVRPAFVSGP